MSDRKAVIKNADMGEEMQQDAVDCATQALEKYNIEKVNIERLPQRLELIQQTQKGKRKIDTRLLLCMHDSHK